MNTLINQLPCPILLTDATGHIIMTNTNLLQLVGGTAEQWQNKLLEDLLPPPSRIFLQTHLWPILYHENLVKEIHMQLYDSQKQRVPVLVNCQRIIRNGQESYYWVFFVAYERSQFEAELLKARSEADQMSENLAQANEQLNILHKQLSLYTKEIEVVNRELSEISQTDPLTGLANRRALHMTVTNWQFHSKVGIPVSVLLIDVDHFKRVNDEYGHDEGDRVLVELARQLQASIRLNDLVVRYGGEEFIIWLPSVDRTRAEFTAQRVHKHIRQVQVAGKPITVSIGVATSLNTLDSGLLQELITHADKAVYQAKAEGRNRTIHFK
jgi:diguanylate cyclase (GGDEF)-like protein/PAS domain S-box-containing protein